MTFGLHYLDNSTNHAFYILHHIVVPEAKNCVALGLQVLRTFFIIRLLIQVLTAIQFNDEFLTRSTKIDNIIPNNSQWRADFGNGCFLIDELEAVPTI